MLKNIKVEFMHIDRDPKLEKLITKKIARLDRYLTKHQKQSAH